MGVAGIWDAIKGVQEPFTDSTDLKVDSKKVIIDGNNVLAIIWNVQGLGLEYFKCSTEAKVKEIAGFISNEILHFIETLVGGDRVVCLVFDGKDREIKKIEKNEKNEKKVKKKANAIRNIFKSQSGHIVGMNTAILTNTIFPDGRLKYLILQGIASKLKVYQAKGEADFVIATLLKSQEWKGAAVMSMDSDYLVFTDCPVVINPIKKYRSVCYKDKVLEKLGTNYYLSPEKNLMFGLYRNQLRTIAESCCIFRPGLYPRSYRLWVYKRTRCGQGFIKSSS
jgi:hypothetical protein